MAIERYPALRSAINYSIIIMDDETYFDLDSHDFHGGTHYFYLDDNIEQQKSANKS